MQYIAFMHCNNDSDTNSDDWERFFELAGKSGVFCGGSAMGRRYTLGEKTVPDITENIGGYMRFETEAFEELTALLEYHPTIMHGGTIEICELPKTS